MADMIKKSLNSASSSVAFAEKEGLKWLEFPQLNKEDGLRFAVFTRWGGVSPPPFHELNISHGIGDDKERVRENRKRMQRILGGKHWRYLRQVHGTHIAVFSGSSATCQSTSENDIYENTNEPYDPSPVEADAAITNIPGNMLVIQTADCQAVMLFDPIRRVIANVHSGWRGSIRNIAGKTVNMMTHHFGCRATDILAAIGPSLGPCCAEFVNYQSEIPKSFWKYMDSQYHFNFWDATRDQLTEAGLRKESVICANLCTRCRTDLFYSYRGEKKTGRFASAVGLAS